MKEGPYFKAEIILSEQDQYFSLLEIHHLKQDLSAMLLKPRLNKADKATLRRLRQYLDLIENKAQPLPDVASDVAKEAWGAETWTEAEQRQGAKGLK